MSARAKEGSVSIVTLLRKAIYIAPTTCERDLRDADRRIADELSTSQGAMVRTGFCCEMPVELASVATD